MPLVLASCSAWLAIQSLPARHDADVPRHHPRHAARPLQPLILRYGGPAATTPRLGPLRHRSRDAPLAQNGDGLLIGRDRKSGKPLRYAGPPIC
jgi:hypothetical protein